MFSQTKIQPSAGSPAFGSVNDSSSEFNNDAPETPHTYPIAQNSQHLKEISDLWMRFYRFTCNSRHSDSLLYAKPRKEAFLQNTLTLQNDQDKDIIELWTMMALRFLMKGKLLVSPENRPRNTVLDIQGVFRDQWSWQMALDNPGSIIYGFKLAHDPFQALTPSQRAEEKPIPPSASDSEVVKISNDQTKPFGTLKSSKLFNNNNNNNNNNEQHAGINKIASNPNIRTSTDKVSSSSSASSSPPLSSSMPPSTRRRTSVAFNLPESMSSSSPLSSSPLTSTSKTLFSSTTAHTPSALNAIHSDDREIAASPIPFKNVFKSTQSAPQPTSTTSQRVNRFQRNTTHDDDTKGPTECPNYKETKDTNPTKPIATTNNTNQYTSIYQPPTSPLPPTPTSGNLSQDEIANLIKNQTVVSNASQSQQTPVSTPTEPAPSMSTNSSTAPPMSVNTTNTSMAEDHIATKSGNNHNNDPNSKPKIHKTMIINDESDERNLGCTGKDEPVRNLYENFSAPEIPVPVAINDLQKGPVPDSPTSSFASQPDSFSKFKFSSSPKPNNNSPALSKANSENNNIITNNNHQHHDSNQDSVSSLGSTSSYASCLSDLQYTDSASPTRTHINKSLVHSTNTNDTPVQGPMKNALPSDFVFQSLNKGSICSTVSDNRASIATVTNNSTIPDRDSPNPQLSGKNTPRPEDLPSKIDSSLDLLEDLNKLSLNCNSFKNDIDSSPPTAVETQPPPPTSSSSSSSPSPAAVHVEEENNAKSEPTECDSPTCSCDNEAVSTALKSLIFPTPMTDSSDPTGPANYIPCAGHSLKRLPFDDNTFDIISAKSLWYFVRKSDWVPTLAELYRVLKPGGYIEMVVSDFNMLNGQSHDHYWWSRLQDNVRNSGLDPFPSQIICDYLYKAQFIDVHRAMISLPRGWGGSVGHLTEFLSLFYADSMFKVFGGFTADEIEQCRLDSRIPAPSGSYPANYMSLVYAQKPFESECL